MKSLALLGILAIAIFHPIMAQDYDVNLEEAVTDRGERSFGLHWPNFIIAGRDDLKLQFSFKYKILKRQNLFFGYTQLMFWDVYKNSKPFRDINFYPEIFYRFPIKGTHSGHIDVGYIHTSNGKGGIESRSLDRPYLRWSSYLYKGDFKILSSLRLYYIMNVDDYNRDILDYLGRWDLTVYFLNLLATPNGESFDFGVSAFAGKKTYDFDKGGVTLSLRYSFQPRDFNPDILLQYYNGRVENLIDFKTKVERIRLGLMFYF